jgi:hypothetical protein
MPTRPKNRRGLPGTPKTKTHKEHISQALKRHHARVREALRVAAEAGRSR